MTDYQPYLRIASAIPAFSGPGSWSDSLQSTGGLGTSKIGLSIGLGLSLPLLTLVAFFLWHKLRRHKREVPIELLKPVPDIPTPPATTAAPHPSYTPPPGLPAIYKDHSCSGDERVDYHNTAYIDEPPIRPRTQPDVNYSNSVEFPSAGVSSAGLSAASLLYSDFNGTRSTPSLPPSYMTNQPATRPSTGDPFDPPRRPRNGRRGEFAYSNVQRGVNSGGYPFF